ncbi:MAG: TrkH family potassium uptake protein [Pseudomonadales bacterium]
MLFSLTMLLPIIVSQIYADGTTSVFLKAFLTTLVSGIVLWLPCRNSEHELRVRDGFLVTAMFWFVLGLFGALPLFLSESPSISVTDAVFESISGLTTTGATVLTGLDSMPKAILFYRQQLQWLGGIGIIVIAVAILPMLGIGGMQLYRAETPGPIKDSKLTPRITSTAKWLFLIYVLMTVGCALSYWLAGMTAFDAIAHGFSTVSIGGFSTHDLSLGYFDSPAILIIAMFYMVFAGINFALHFYAWRRVTLNVYFTDPELKFYLTILAIGAFVVVLTLGLRDTMSWSDAALHGTFQVVSIATTTGFASANFSAWPAFVPFLLIAMAFIGACAGSTGGGMKVIRALLMLKQGLREIKQLVHPHALIPIKLGHRPVAERVMSAIWGFIAVYIVTFIFLTLVLMGMGLDFVSAYAAAAASLNNLGPGLGQVATHYGDISNPAKWLLCFAMLLGRLEIFTLLVLFSPLFWRK